MGLADTLSKAWPARTLLHEDLGTEPLLQVCNIVIRSQEASLKYARATESDEELSVVLKLSKNGWPSFKKGCSKRALPYWSIQLSLTTVDGLVFYGSRLVIPISLRAEVLALLHKAHQGVSKMLQRAEGAVFWPGLRHRVEDTALSCEPCRTAERRERKEPLIPVLIPDYPFQKWGVDVFSLHEVDYLLVVFADWGTPEFLVSDNGPQIRAKEFKDFCHSRNVTPIYTSPLHPSGNGQVERTIGMVKGMMKRSVRGQTDWIL